jgi:EGF domain-containing protein/growth factor-like EGF protein
MSCRTAVSRLLMCALFLLLATAAQALPPVGGDPCDGVECNHGACVSSEGEARCECHEGYTGDDCNTIVDPCDGVECNHGSCVSSEGEARCECDDGYTGDDCNGNIDECASEPCLNNGNCLDQVAGYVCDCPSGFTGANCEIDVDECASSPCVRGTCLDQVNKFVCICPPGFTGPLCDIDIDECESNPCFHGDCTNLENAYSCSCDTGWTGTNCDVPVVTLDCSGAVASPGLLWPPNHQLVPISVIDVIDPNGGTVTVTITGVSQDEPVNGLGDGDTSPDATGVGTANAAVRSERAGNGDGRVYHITFSATSTSGSESCTGTVTVGVPKSQGKKGGPVDGGALYNSTQP